METSSNKILGKAALILAVISSLCFLFIPLYIGGSIALVLATVAALTGDLVFAAATVTVLLLMAEFIGSIFLPTSSETLSWLTVVLFLLPPITICYKALHQRYKIKIYSFLFLCSVLVVLYRVELIKFPWMYKQLHPTKDSLAWILADTPCLNSLDPNCLSAAAVKLAVNQTDSFPKITTLNNIANLQLKLGDTASAKETALMSYQEITKPINHYMLKTELTSLAILLNKVEEHEKSEEALEKALAIARRQKTPSILDVAVWLCQAGLIEECREVFVEALEAEARSETKGQGALQSQYKVISELTSAGDIEGALSISKMTKHQGPRDNALGNLSKKLSTQGQKEYAYQLASAIADPSLKEETLHSINELWVKSEGDVHEVLKYVGKYEAPLDRDREIKLCVEGHLQSGHTDQAITIAANIEDAEVYASALEHIFLENKGIKPTVSNIEDVIRKIDGLKDPTRRSNALLDLAYLQMRHGDKKGFVKTLSEVEILDKKNTLLKHKQIQLYSLYLRHEAYFDTTMQEISQLPKAARNEFSEYISFRLAMDGNFDEAIQVVEFIGSDLVKFRQLLAIAILQFKFSNGQDMQETLNKAQEVAWQIPNDAWVDHQRDISLERIVAIQVLAGLSEKAFENAQHIEYDMYRKKALRDIAVAKTILGDFRGALEMIWPLKNPQYILEIAEIMSNNYERGGRPTSGLCTLNTVIHAKYTNWCYDYLM